MNEGEKDFLARWSRRKVEARDGGLKKKQDEPVHKPGRMRTDPPAPKQPAPVAEVDAEAAQTREASLKQEQPPAKIEEQSEGGAEEAQEIVDPKEFEDFDFDSLNYASDYTRFMKKGVPEAVRRRALRMLWSSNPILANIDGLNDYDEDFTDAALAVKGLLKTSYKPGKGYLTDEERNASYSEEARKHAEDEAKRAEAERAEVDDQAKDADDADAGDMDDPDGADDEARITTSGDATEKPENDPA